MPLDPMFSLAGHTALVTGGGSGLGRAIAEALSDAGAALVLVGRRRDMLASSLGERAGHVLPIDLMQADAAQRCKSACDELGCAPDIVVNAAGINPRLPADTIDEAAWQATLHLNLSVPFLIARQFVPAMRRNNWGRIINIASLQSFRAFEHGIAYGASKGGITQLTRAMAEAWSRHGINVNAIAPGFFKTDLTAAVFKDEALAALHAGRTAIGRNGELADLAGPAVFLSSDASRYVTGQVLAVDGGYTAK